MIYYFGVFLVFCVAFFCNSAASCTGNVGECLGRGPNAASVSGAWEFVESSGCYGGELSDDGDMLLGDLRFLSNSILRVFKEKHLDRFDKENYDEYSWNVGASRYYPRFQELQIWASTGAIGKNEHSSRSSYNDTQRFLLFFEPEPKNLLRISYLCVGDSDGTVAGQFNTNFYRWVPDDSSDSSAGP